MKAMLLHEPKPADRRPLTLAEVPVPDPGPKQILIKVSICGICHTDLHQVEGELPMHRRPTIPGHQIVGTVARRGPDTRRFKIGDRAGVAWLHEACGECSFCSEGLENLCDRAKYTGWDVDGGYAEYTIAPEEFAYPIPEGFGDTQAAPLFCAGIIGYRALRLSEIKPGQRLGLYGFGAAAHITIQVAKHWSCEVYVFTRSESHRQLARELGAAWVGGAKDDPPAKMHSSIIFAPAGPLVLDAMRVLEKGGTCGMGGIYMTPVPPLDYTQHLYDEKTLRSVTNATKQDGEELLALAAKIPIKTKTQCFALDQANEALVALKTGGIDGAGVLIVS